MILKLSTAIFECNMPIFTAFNFYIFVVIIDCIYIKIVTDFIQYFELYNCNSDQHITRRLMTIFYIIFEEIRYAILKF